MHTSIQAYLYIGVAKLKFLVAFKNTLTERVLFCIKWYFYRKQFLFINKKVPFSQMSRELKGMYVH